jgi:type IV pilus assembly protein PilC
MAGIDLNKVASAPPVKKAATPSSLLDILNRDISLFKAGFSDRKKEELYTELGILLTAGVDIKTTLELVADEQEKQKDRAVVEQIKNRVVGGSTLSEALRATGQFTAYEYYSLQIGEESGKIGIVLRELAVFYQKKIKQRRQVVSALTYPAIVLSASAGAVFFMMNFIVPMFADIFARFGGKLPALTRLILHISEMIRNYFWPLTIGIAALIVVIYRQRNKLWFRKYSTRILLKIPLFGEIIRKIYLARFCHSMTLLIGSRIPLLRAISLVRQMIGFYPIEDSLSTVEANILKGLPLHSALSEFPIYHKRMISLIKVGEEVNQLEGFFDKIAKQYTEDVEHQTAMIGSLIEPFMIIFLGLVVGIILIAMYLPLFNLSNTI